jgi:hypothetical protein
MYFAKGGCELFMLHASQKLGKPPKGMKFISEEGCQGSCQVVETAPDRQDERLIFGIQAYGPSNSDCHTPQRGLRVGFQQYSLDIFFNVAKV